MNTLFADTLKKLRAIKGLTQIQLANLSFDRLSKRFFQIYFIVLMLSCFPQSWSIPAPIWPWSRRSMTIQPRDGGGTVVTVTIPDSAAK